MFFTNVGGDEADVERVRGKRTGGRRARRITLQRGFCRSTNSIQSALAPRTWASDVPTTAERESAPLAPAQAAAALANTCFRDSFRRTANANGDDAPRLLRCGS
jgi:hypothetical protein